MFAHLFIFYMDDLPQQIPTKCEPCIYLTTLMWRHIHAAKGIFRYWNKSMLLFEATNGLIVITGVITGVIRYAWIVFVYLFESWSLIARATNIYLIHYSDVIMTAIASQITSLTIVYSSVYSGADQSKHQSSASLVFVRGIHRGPVNSPHKWPVTRKMFPFDDVIMIRLASN